MFSRLLLRVATRVEEFGLAELLPVRQMKLVNLFLVHLRLNPASTGTRQVTEPDRTGSRLVVRGKTAAVHTEKIEGPTSSVMTARESA
jgi:hypothetical protein